MLQLAREATSNTTTSSTFLPAFESSLLGPVESENVGPNSLQAELYDT
jgi:hypothetical protein